MGSDVIGFAFYKDHPAENGQRSWEVLTVI